MNKKLKKILSKALILGSLTYLGTNTCINAADAKDLPSTICKTKTLANPISSCKNYIIYYGWKFDSNVMANLSTYDLVVINPLESGASAAREALQAQGILVYGYASSIEIPSYDDDMVNSISDNEKLKVNGTIVNHYGNELGDLTLSSYRKKVVDSILDRICDGGYDGVFIDTLDDLEGMRYILQNNDLSVSNIDEYTEDLEYAGVSLLREIKEANPNLSIIQNRGFELLDKGSNALIDSFLYESISKSSNESFYARVKPMLDRFVNDHNGVVMALPTSKKYYSESRQLCIDNGWLYYQATSYTKSPEGTQFILN